LYATEGILPGQLLLSKEVIGLVCRIGPMGHEAWPGLDPERHTEKEKK